MDISAPLRTAEKVRNLSALDMPDQLTTLLTWRDTEQEPASLTSKDILISPRLGEITSMDFERVALAIDKGLQGARDQRWQLRRLSVSPSAYADYLAAHKPPAQHNPTIDFVRIENDSPLDDEIIARRLEVEPGQPLDMRAMESAVNRIYGLDVFESVAYEVVKEDGNTGVLVRARERRGSRIEILSYLSSLRGRKMRQCET